MISFTCADLSFWTLIFVHVLLLFICPFLEIWKLKLFEDNQLFLNMPLEYIYLALVSYQIVMHFIICCCHHWFNARRLRITVISVGILWLIIPAFYTYYTINELGEIPQTCPSNYNYSFKTMRIICEIRLSNLIAMWLRFASIVIIAVFISFGSERLNSWMGFNDDDDKKKSVSSNKRRRKSRQNSRSGEVGAVLVSE